MNYSASINSVRCTPRLFTDGKVTNQALYNAESKILRRLYHHHHHNEQLDVHWISGDLSRVSRMLHLPFHPTRLWHIDSVAFMWRRFRLLCIFFAIQVLLNYWYPCRRLYQTPTIGTATLMLLCFNHKLFKWQTTLKRNQYFLAPSRPIFLGWCSSQLCCSSWPR